MNVALRVRAHMSTDMLSVRPHSEIMHLIHQLVDRNLPGAMVTDEDGRLLGIVTERDCIEVATQAGYFDELGGSVADYMSTDLETLDPDDSLMDIAERMCASSHRLFPVVEDGKLIGMLSRRHVLKLLSSGAWFAQQASQQA